MKKLITIAAIIFLFSFSDEKKYGVEMSVPQWNKHLNKLEGIRQIAEESNLPYQQVKFITKTIDSLELDVVPQIQKQLKDSIKQK